MPNQSAALARWAFTLNDYTPEEEQKLVGALTPQTAVYAIVARKRAPTTGTPHLQGFVHLRRHQRFDAVKKLLDTPRVHLEPARGTDQENRDYCRKDGDVVLEVGKTWSRGESIDSYRRAREVVERVASGTCETVAAACREDPLDWQAVARHRPAVTWWLSEERREPGERILRQQYEGAVLRPWQEEVVRELEKGADDRIVLWVMDYRGNRGKTWLTGYLEARWGQRGVCVVSPCCKPWDVAYLLPDGEQLRLVLYDVPHTEGPQLMAEHAGLLEQLKAGRVLSTKYEPRRKLYPQPLHVLVLANGAPEALQLSYDRLDLREIVEGDILKRRACL